MSSRATGAQGAGAQGGGARRIGALALWALACVGSTLLFDQAHARSLGRAVHALGEADVEVRALAAARVSQAGPAAVPALLGGLEFAETDPALRVANVHRTRTSSIMRALRALDRSVSVPALIAALDDPREPVRHYAGVVLASLEEDALPALSNALATSPLPRIRTAAAWTLSLVGPAARAAFPALEAALGDEHRSVRYTARYAMEMLRTENDVYWDAVLSKRERAINR